MLCCGLIILLPSLTFGQKYSFTNYSIEDGLLQSQATRILQDNTRHLVISTFLGMNKFDGKTFTTAMDNSITGIVKGETIDHNGRIWYSNSKGLYEYYGGKTTRFVGDKNDSLIFANTLITDKENNIWGLRKEHLFKIAHGKLKNIKITIGTDTITSISADKRESVFAAILNKGIFQLRNDKWVNISSPALPRGTYIWQFIIGDHEKDPIYISTGMGVLSVTNNIAKKLNINYQKDGVSSIYCITRDHLNGLWIGTNKGAYYSRDNNLKYFNESNGFTNNYVYDIFEDFDNNIWLGTNGSGIFRFNGDAYLIFDQAQGLPGSILQIGNDNGNANSILMTDGNKLMAYNGKKIAQVKIPRLDTIDNLYHSLYTDQEKNTWIVTRKELWKKNRANFTCFYPRNKTDINLSFNAILQDQFKTFWAATGEGCYYWNNGFKKISGINSQCTNLIEIGRDSILAGTMNNVFLIKNKKIDYRFNAGFLKSSDILCMKSYKGHLYVGTIDNGLFIWDMHGDPVIRLNEKNGLNSISVYSIGVDENGIMWIGTGRGVNKFTINNDGSLQKIIDENLSDLFIECDQDALYFNKGKVWIGTTKGLFVFKSDLTAKSVAAPYTSMQDVRFYNKQTVNYTYENGYKEPENLDLPFNYSHITLTFNGIYLKNPRDILYSYQLWPLDKEFCPPVKNNVVDYPSLPPGEYTFYVKSYAPTGVVSNIASFSFAITPAYYQRLWFKIALVILSLACGALLWKYFNVKEEQKRKLIAHLRLEEQIKIRKQTAEDFHDDLGNKLTRINVLSDILNNKIDTSLPDQKKLIDQIKENADALFTGSKHILWALDPANDRLSEVLNHINEFGMDLFLNTSISFTSTLTDDRFKEIILPMGYGRNITLICKELFNNTLKHSGAKNVNASAFLDKNSNICIIIEDDGNGFDTHNIKSGNGTRNINNRAKKMNGIVIIRSTVGKGTMVTLVIEKTSNLYS